MEWNQTQIVPVSRCRSCFRWNDGYMCICQCSIFILITDCSALQICNQNDIDDQLFLDVEEQTGWFRSSCSCATLWGTQRLSFFKSMRRLILSSAWRKELVHQNYLSGHIQNLLEPDVCKYRQGSLRAKRHSQPIVRLHWSDSPHKFQRWACGTRFALNLKKIPESRGLWWWSLQCAPRCKDELDMAITKVWFVFH